MLVCWLILEIQKLRIMSWGQAENACLRLLGTENLIDVAVALCLLVLVPPPYYFWLVNLNW
jgi:hypothetical protein